MTQGRPEEQRGSRAAARAARVLGWPAALRAAAQIVALGGLLAAVAAVMRPWLKDLSTFGFHDWDVQTSHRELVRQSLLRYGEFPGWNPFACGGFPAWGYVEGGTAVVSPWLPLYLALPMSLALRLEVLGMALVGALGAYVLAGRFTSSHAARALVAALWAVNGRWGLQTAAGHTWHLAYAWMPWCLAFYERARGARPPRACASGESARDPGSAMRALDLALAGGAIAMLVYSGGIYPLPHTVLLLGLYAAGMAVSERSIRPLTTLAAAGAVGIGLSAPKLLPLLDNFKKAPRLIASTESLELGAFFTMLTSRQQEFYARPARVTPYGWHEWGMYIGVAGVLILGAALLLVEGRRERVLKVAGALFLLLGFGAFHPQAPWTLMHAHLPVFRSQHVPSRFLYPAVLILALVAAAGLGRFIARRSLRWPWLDLVAAIAVVALALDVAEVARKPMANAMWMVPPDRLPTGRAFHFEQEPPFHYKRRDWAGPMYLAMLGNTGVLNCYGTPPFDRKGARAITDPAYRGEVFLSGEGGAAAPGQVRLVGWSPNRATVEVSGAEAGALLVYNMNFDEGWGSDVGPVIEHESAVAVRLPAGASQVTFQYRPPGLRVGIALAAGTALALLALGWRQRRAGA